MKAIRTGVALLVASALVACSHMGRLTSGVDDQCESLKAIAADALSGFKASRGSASDFSRGRIYQTKTQLITGHCEIWEWGNGEIAYTCSASSPTQEIADARYQKSVSAVQQCLSSPTWAQMDKASAQGEEETSGEKNTYLVNADSNVQVRLRMLKIDKPMRAEYANYLLVRPLMN